MARFPRLNIPGIPQHVVQRGNNRQACFFAAEDYAFYLAKLSEAANKFSVQVHGFVLMTNHVHLLVTPLIADGVSRMMQCLGRNYVRYINIMYKRSGTLWEGRFKSCLVQDSRYLLTVLRYIELNPVRANMVSHPRDYNWSSYHHNGGNKTIRLITPHKEYDRLGNCRNSRRRHYNTLIEQGIVANELEEIKTSINQSKILGNQRFKDEVSQMLASRVEPARHGGDRRSRTFKQSEDN